MSSTSAPLSARSLSALEAPPAGGASGARDFAHYLARKLAAAMVSFAMLLVLGFIIFSLMPSDPVEALTRGHPTSAKQIAFLVKQLGLNQPVWERFGHFVRQHPAGAPGLLLAVRDAGRHAHPAAAVADAAADGLVHDRVGPDRDVARHPQRLAAGQAARPRLDRDGDHVLVGADVLARASCCSCCSAPASGRSRRCSRRAACRRREPRAAWPRRTSSTSPGTWCCRA